MSNRNTYILVVIVAICAAIVYGAYAPKRSIHAEAETQATERETRITERETPAAETETEAETQTETWGAGREAKVIEIMATAYCPCVKCCGKTDGITATGTKATAGRTVAVDPDVIPYGAEIVIDGHSYIAEDCGGAINGNDIDIYFDTHDEALQFGRQTLTAYIYE